MTAIAAAFIGIFCGVVLAVRALDALWQRDQARMDRDHYHRLWLNESHDSHALVMAVVNKLNPEPSRTPESGRGM